MLKVELSEFWAIQISYWRFSFVDVSAICVNSNVSLFWLVIKSYWKFSGFPVITFNRLGALRITRLKRSEASSACWARYMTLWGSPALTSWRQRRSFRTCAACSSGGMCQSPSTTGASGKSEPRPFRRCRRFKYPGVWNPSKTPTVLERQHHRPPIEALAVVALRYHNLPRLSNIVIYDCIQTGIFF